MSDIKNKGIRERISALMDGEVSEFEARRVLNEIGNDPELRRYWQRLQLSSTVLRNELVENNLKDISLSVQEELEGKKISIPDIKVSSSFNLVKLSSSFIIGLFCILSVNYFLYQEDSGLTFHEEISKNIEGIISSSEAIAVLNEATSGLDIKMEDLRSGNQGELYANFIRSDSSAPFTVSLSPISSVSNDKLNADSPLKVAAIIKTKSGIFLLGVKGNISQHEKSVILHNANFIANSKR